MSYAEIDHQIDEWVTRHSLKLFKWGEHEIRCVYMSSLAGECFQIWIDAPIGKNVSLYAAGVEGRRDGLPPERWDVSVVAVGEGLETAFETVIGWMIPSSRYVPDAERKS